MHTHSLKDWRHEHVFLGADHRRNERRTWLVVGLTATMMVVEIIGGTMLGSMALIADGWHMSTHAAALTIAALAYRFASKHAHDAQFTFGTGKLGELAAFASAMILAVVAVLIGYESAIRLWQPVAISFDQALVIAHWSIGLMRTSGAVLLDIVPDAKLAGEIRRRLESGDDRLADLHLWRLGPGHIGVIASVVSDAPQAPDAYKARLSGLHGLSHVTVEVHACRH